MSGTLFVVMCFDLMVFGVMAWNATRGQRRLRDENFQLRLKNLELQVKCMQAGLDALRAETENLRHMTDNLRMATEILRLQLLVFRLLVARQHCQQYHQVALSAATHVIIDPDGNVL